MATNLVKGSFEVKWGANTLYDISEVSLDYSQNSNDYDTIQGNTYTVEGSIKASVTLKFLKSDVESLAVALPQYYVPNGGVMSSGETVTDENGAIDIKAASCDVAPTYNDLDIISCGDPGDVFRLKNARTVIDSMEFADNSVRTVSVKFVGEPESGDGNIQFFKEGALSTVS